MGKKRKEVKERIKERKKEEERKIFISHRHRDKEIANQISKHLQLWGINPDWIYQSSVNAQVGKEINQQIMEFIANAKLIILIYTADDEDWSYCMWEAGVATDPKQEVRRIVVFQCTDDRPKPLRNQVSVPISREKIREFTEQFHKNSDFFPGLGPFQKNVNEDILKSKSDVFYNDLQPVIPKSKSKAVYRWDYLRLELDKDSVNILGKETEVENRRNVIQENCKVTKVKFSALQHFGYNDFEEGLVLKNLIDRWDEKVYDINNTQREWVNKLCDGIFKVIINDQAKSKWRQLESANRGEDNFFFPVVNHARVLSDGSMEFDIYFYRVSQTKET